MILSACAVPPQLESPSPSTVGFRQVRKYQPDNLYRVQKFKSKPSIKTWSSPFEPFEVSTEIEISHYYSSHPVMPLCPKNIVIKSPVNCTHAFLCTCCSEPFPGICGFLMLHHKVLFFQINAWCHFSQLSGQDISNTSDPDYQFKWHLMDSVFRQSSKSPIREATCERHVWL